MADQLNEIEARVVGALVEKQLTTPEYYPLTMNALVNACNQKNNREPVMHLDEPTVSAAIERLRDRNIVYVFYGSSSRVPKYKHMLPSVYELEPAEVAVIAVMLLRGPQTPGELRTRTERMYEFESLGDVQETLERLMRRDDPLVVKLPVLPGQKEARFAHLLSGEPDVESLAASHPVRTSNQSGSTERITKLEEEVALLRTEVDSLLAEFSRFKQQFE
ncbi:MAG: YceH family protein [Acidobacteria bacterium]|nr:YceH family protein [Acidobacteriota bacterium]MCW5950285.1 YceH family protein [Pyrinomonadaceae bacterium]